MRNFFLLMATVITFPTLHAQLLDTTAIEEAELLSIYEQYMDSVENTLTYETGTIVLQDGLATLEVPNGYKYLNGTDSEMVLTDLWGNPPSETPSLGMLFPENSGASDDGGYAINIEYSEEGYIDDSDAKDIDYDDLLETMQEDEAEVNEYRAELGYGGVYLLGWASAPYYDATNKKLHWAKELRFEDVKGTTLNYNIRVLGRKGYLLLNVIGDMNVLPDVQADIDAILPAVTFNDGHRYADFNPDLDEVAAYGIGGLIAGKVLAKTGLLATLGVLLAKLWKVILIAIVGIGAGIRKFLGKKEVETEA